MSFKKDFMWGVSSAAYQVEGAYNEDGKGLGIWDALSESKGKVARGEAGNIACDHYHLYKDDVKIMKELGLKHYRFSVSWSRVMPEGAGRVNEKGLEFYSNLLDELNAAKIEPMMTLYHWNMPYELYKKGGWLHEDSSEWFAEYTKVVVNALGDKVRYWLTFNEPQIFTFLGYRVGIHAPFDHYTDEQFIAMTKNVLLAHGKAVKIIRDALGDKALISFSPTGDCHIPENNTEKAIEKAYNKSLELGHNFMFSNTWWSDPVFFRKYADGAKERFGDEMFKFTEEEFDLVSQPLDFFAYNVYQSATEFRDGREINEMYEYPGCPKTLSGWCVTPEVLYWTAKFWHKRYNLPVFITENGCALNDWVCLDGKVYDYQRIDFLTRYLRELKRAADEGVDIWGYTHWSFTDNFEWASGYEPRYGLVHVDFRTMERTIKESGFWYKKVIETNGDNL